MRLFSRIPVLVQQVSEQVIGDVHAAWGLPTQMEVRRNVVERSDVSEPVAGSRIDYELSAIQPVECGGGGQYESADVAQVRVRRQHAFGFRRNVHIGNAGQTERIVEYGVPEQVVVDVA